MLRQEGLLLPRQTALQTRHLNRRHLLPVTPQVRARLLQIHRHLVLAVLRQTHRVLHLAHLIARLRHLHLRLVPRHLTHPRIVQALHHLVLLVIPPPIARLLVHHQRPQPHLALDMKAIPEGTMPHYPQE